MFSDQAGVRFRPIADISVLSKSSLAFATLAAMIDRQGAPMSFAQTLRKPFQLLDRHLPDRIPRLPPRTLGAVRLLWFLALALAVVGPLAGAYLRLTGVTEGSVIIPGSRAGIAVAQDDATQIRFPIGTVMRRAGIRSGDDLIAIDNQRLPDEVPLSGPMWDAQLAEPSSDPASEKVERLLSDSADSDIRLTVRSPEGEIRVVTVRTGKNHIEEEVHRLGMPLWFMRLGSIVHVVFYPLLLWVAVVLHVRNPNQTVPTLLSFAILLSIASELPSSSFLMELGVPLFAQIALYDLSNMGLVAAILLFPDGRLTPRRVLIPLGLLPVLFFLSGDQLYNVALLTVLIVAVTVFVKRLKDATDATRQQLKFLFVGLAAYPVFRSLAYLLGVLNWEVSSISQIILIDAAGGALIALSAVALYFVLFSALRRHRLYDAEELFSRSAMVAAVTLTITGFFAITSTVLQSTSESLLGQNAGPWPSLIAAAAAVLLIKPAQRRIHDWAERQFQKGLFELRTELPKRMDDLRETTSVSVLLKHALRSIVAVLRSTRAAAIVNGRVVATTSIAAKDVRQWLSSAELDDCGQPQCERADDLFPLRLPLRSGKFEPRLVGWILLGPRPDRSIYSRDERQALIDIEEAVARAAEVAYQRQQMVAAERRWKARQEKRLQNVEEQLSKLLTEGNPKLAAS